MRPATHLVAFVLGIAGPVGFTLWSQTDYGPRSRAHYERAAAMRTDTQSVLERLARAEGITDAEIVAEGERGVIVRPDNGPVDLFRVTDGRVADRITLVRQDQLSTDQPTQETSAAQ